MHYPNCVVSCADETTDMNVPENVPLLNENICLMNSFDRMSQKSLPSESEDRLHVEPNIGEASSLGSVMD